MAEAEKNKGGRPTIFTNEFANKICLELMDGKSLRKICLSEDMPNRTTVHDWLNNNDEFSNQYTRAREVQAETIFDECIDIADDSSNDYIKTDEKEVVNHENISRSKLRIDTRMTMIKQLKPKKFRDSKDLNVNVNNVELVPPTIPDED